MNKRSKRGDDESAGKPAPRPGISTMKTSRQVEVFETIIFVLERLKTNFQSLDPDEVAEKMIDMGHIPDLEVRDFLKLHPYITSQIGVGAYGYVLTLQYCLIASNNTHEKRYSEAYCCIIEAMFWAGVSASSVWVSEASEPLFIAQMEKLVASRDSERARKSALMRNTKDSSRLAMTTIKDVWIAMQRGDSPHMSDAQFARTMARKHSEVAEGSIKNAITRWRREKSSSQQNVIVLA